ncbi:MAG TPA: class I SAM-dependent methyltransferase [Planctomycetota bacterium]|nr:class I SAM-dependent methyltransferase [Planctomycetota bacterium]
MDDADPLAIGEDFEYRSSPDSFLAVRCRRCGLVYLNPRPDTCELDRIYPPDYHAFNFSEGEFGFVYKVRRRLEARRLLDCCAGLEAGARILDIGCGDGFHLDLLREFGNPGWHLEGVDSSPRAVEAATRRGLTVHRSFVQDCPIPPDSIDLALMIATIEHVDNPPDVLVAVRRLLKPGGRIVIVTDNAAAPDARLFQGRHWGGYHFPRHWNLFTASTLRALAQKTGLDVESLGGITSPVNWVYSIRNRLVDADAPAWMIRRFSLSTPVSLGIFTILDSALRLIGKSGLLRAILKKPAP